MVAVVVGVLLLVDINGIDGNSMTTAHTGNDSQHDGFGGGDCQVFRWCWMMSGSKLAVI